MADTETNERAAEQALARLERRRPEAFGPVEAEVDAYEEAMALLAWGLAPEPPAALARERLLAAVAQPSAVAETPAPIPFRPAPAQPAPAQPRQYWLLAAVLVAALALGYWLGRPAAEPPTALVQADLQAQIDRQAAELQKVARQLEMVKTVARQAYRLEGVEGIVPVAAPQPAPEPLEGIVFVCGHHQQFLLTLKGLPSAPTDREYHLWFVTDQGEVDGGALAVADHRAELEAPQMPPGTRGFLVSLEPKGPGGAGPRGELIVRSQPPVRL